MAKVLKYQEIYNYFRDLIESGALAPNDKLPTEEEIKQKFNVSQITVIKGLNQLTADGYITRIQGSGSYVSEATLEDDELKLILMIIPFKGRGRESHLIQSMENELTKNGYHLIIKNSKDDSQIERSIINQFKDKVEGIILYPVLNTINHTLYQELHKENYPIIYIDRYPSSTPCSFVSSDNANGGAEIAKYLLSENHEHFIMLFFDIVNLTSERERFNGFMNVLHDNQIPMEHTSFYCLNNDKIYATETQAVDELLDSIKSGKKTAVFACNDSIAYGIMDKIKERDVSHLYSMFTVAGFDNLNLAPVSMPFITINQQHSLISYYAAELLIRRINKKYYPCEYRYVPVNLVVPSQGINQNIPL